MTAEFAMSQAYHLAPPSLSDYQAQLVGEDQRAHYHLGSGVASSMWRSLIPLQSKLSVVGW